MKTTFLLTIGLMMMNSSQAEPLQDPLPELKTVSHVDLSKYAGTWYQIAYFPTRFQKNCEQNTRAIYSLRPDGKIGVRNECTNTHGKAKSIEGKARIVDPVTQAKLKVKFFWFAPAGDYWIIDLGEKYEYAVVGTPSRKYLWILSRDPQMDKAVYERLVARAQEQAFDTKKLKLTSQLSF